jgi:hypothetical protein
VIAQGCHCLFHCLPKISLPFNSLLLWISHCHTPQLQPSLDSVPLTQKSNGTAVRYC